MYLTYPSARDLQISRSDSSVVSIFNKIPEFLGAKVGVALTALGAGMSFMDPSFLKQLNALNLPLQLQLAQKKCGSDFGEASGIFTEFNSTRISSATALRLQWAERNSVAPRTFVDGIMKSPRLTGVSSARSVGSSDMQSIFFRHSESSSLVFLRVLPQLVGDIAIPSATSNAKNCSRNSTACRAATDGVLFMSDSSPQAGYVLSPTAFRCPLCARDSSLSHAAATAALVGIHRYASGKSDFLSDSDLSLLPSAVAELNILASLKSMLSQASAAWPDVSAVSVTGLNGVSFVVNDAADPSLKSTALWDYSQKDWFVNAANEPGVLHVSNDPAYDSGDSATFAHTVSVGVTANAQGLPWSASESQTKGIAAVAKMRIRSSWLASVLTSALLRHDSRHICMSAAGICAIVNSRGFIVASTASNRSIFQHIDTMYPVLAQALLDNKVFNQTWSHQFRFTEFSDHSVRGDRSALNVWSLNKAGPSKFRVFAAESLYSVSIARLSGVAGLLLVVVPQYSLNSDVQDLELRRFLPVTPDDGPQLTALSPKGLLSTAEMEDHSHALTLILQENSCERIEPSWLLGVSIASGMAVLFFVIVIALHRFGVFQKVLSYLFQRKSQLTPSSSPPKTSDDVNRFQFKLCSPNDFPVQKSILRCVNVFHKAFSNLEQQIISLNTRSLSKRIIGDDIDGQRIKIQNYLEVLKKQRTLLHERIVSRMCATNPPPPPSPRRYCNVGLVTVICRLLCASLRLRASAYADIIDVLAENAAQFEVEAAVFALEHGGVYFLPCSFYVRLLPSRSSL